MVGRQTFNRTSAKLIPPVKKERLEKVKKQREDEAKKQHELKMKELKEQEAKKKTETVGGVKIAPKCVNFTDRQLELLVRHMLKKYPKLLSHRVEENPDKKYVAVDKSVPGPKFIKEKNMSVRHYQD